MGDGDRRSRPFEAGSRGTLGRRFQAVSGGERGSPGRAVQAGIRGKRLRGAGSAKEEHEEACELILSMGCFHIARKLLGAIGYFM